MTPTRRQLEGLVMQIQGEFLETPALRLTVPEAAQRFGVDRTVCDAVMGLLADARVLARSTEGVFRRFFPRAGSQVQWHAA